MRTAWIIGTVAALVLCAWFALGIRQAHDTASATAILAQSTPLSKPELARAAALLHAAGLLNPDREVDVLRGQLALREGNAAAARRILAPVTRAEPMNIEAWLWLAKSSNGDPRTFLIALSHVRALDPIVPAVP